eukprot:1143110-Pelagomonas_calceolata.AAC.2
MGQGLFLQLSSELAPSGQGAWTLAHLLSCRLGLNPEVVESARAGLDTSMSVADDTIRELEEARIRLRNEETARCVRRGVRALEEETV